MPEIKLDLNASLPGEAIAVKFLDTYDKARANMDPEIRKGWDKLGLEILTGWHNRCVELGWPGKKV